MRMFVRGTCRIDRNIYNPKIFPTLYNTLYRIVLYGERVESGIRMHPVPLICMYPSTVEWASVKSHGERFVGRTLDIWTVNLLT